MKFGVLSFIVPPSASGVTMVLYHLLSGFRAGDYCLISEVDYRDQPVDQSYTDFLPAPYHTVAQDSILRLGQRFNLAQRLAFVFIPLGIILRSLRIAKVLRSEHCQALLACTGGWDCLNMPAGYLACRMLRIPFYFYVFDYYSKQWEGPTYWGNGGYAGFGRWLEKVLVKGAAGVIVPNEFLRDALKKQFRVEPTVLHNSCDLSQYSLAPETPEPHNGIKIIYTGDIYEAHFDAFNNLLKAIENLDTVTLHAYSIRSREYLEAHGLKGRVVFHPHVPNAEISKIHQQADVLFLALAFHSPYPDAIRTAAPGKIGEYLASGRPILVHAPRDSFVAWYFRQHECGLVVDEENPAELTTALEKLLSDEQLRNRLVANALSRAIEDFDLHKMRETLARTIQGDARVNSNEVGEAPKHARTTG
jgi:glycosyltransferase involved in cell wall biosynthesis